MWRSFYLNNRLFIENYIFCEINIYFGAYYLWNHSFERYIVIYTCIFWEHRKYIWKLEKKRKLNVGSLSQSSVPAPLHTLHETMTGGPRPGSILLLPWFRSFSSPRVQPAKRRARLQSVRACEFKCRPTSSPSHLPQCTPPWIDAAPTRPVRPSRSRAMHARHPRPCSYRFLATINGD